MNSYRSSALMGISIVLGVAAFGAGCSEESSSTTPTMADSGSVADTGMEADSGVAADTGTASTLYTRLGGHDGIAGAVHLIVVEELKDSEISAFFGAVGTAGHPTAGQIEGCFTALLGSVAGGPEVYPTTIDGFTCRDMKSSHAALKIPGATFDKFVTIAAGVLKTAGVADADITTIGGVLNGTKTDIVVAADAG